MDWWEEDPGRTSELNEFEICPQCNHLFSDCGCEYIPISEEE